MEAGRGGLGESSQGLGPLRKQGLKGWDGEQKAARADGEGVKIDQRPGRSIITTWHSSQTRIKHYLCSFAFLGCQEVSGTLQLLGCAWLLWSLGTAAMGELTGAELHERSLV